MWNRRRACRGVDVGYVRPGPSGPATAGHPRGRAGAARQTRGVGGATWCGRPLPVRLVQQQPGTPGGEPAPHVKPAALAEQPGVAGVLGAASTANPGNVFRPAGFHPGSPAMNLIQALPSRPRSSLYRQPGQRVPSGGVPSGFPGDEPDSGFTERPSRPLHVLGTGGARCPAAGTSVNASVFSQQIRSGRRVLCMCSVLVERAARRPEHR